MSAPTPVLDALSRPLRNLRLSVTDRCNLRCAYCMPAEDYVWLPRSDILDFEEIDRLVGIFERCGVDKLRITGGEPLLRRDLPDLIRLLARHTGLRDLALTTNGLLLEEQAGSLFDAGLHRITVSLDTLKHDRFRELTRRDELDRVLAGIEAVRRLSVSEFKLDAVILRGTNDDELADLIEFARSVGAELRFIEYMDVGGATEWKDSRVVSRKEMLERLSVRYGAIATVDERGSAPAERFRLADGTTFGIIASTTSPFCGACDRSRVTADGMWYHCLYAPTGRPLRPGLRDGSSDAVIEEFIRTNWSARTDRGAEDRLRTSGRSSLFDRDYIRDKPHLEMHTRGG